MQQMMAMMQGGGAGAAAPAVTFSTLVSFKAGKCSISSTTNPAGAYTITPIKKKGTLKLIRTNSSNNEGEGIIKLIWSERKGQNELQSLGADELMVFPNEAKFLKIDTAKAPNTARKVLNERVYSLQYNNNGRRFFYWLQDVDASKDLENINTINKFMNDHAAAAAHVRNGGVVPAALSAAASPAAAAAGANANTSASFEEMRDYFSGVNGVPSDSVMEDGDVNANISSAEAAGSEAMDITSDMDSSILNTTAAASSSSSIAAATPAQPGLNNDSLQSILSGLGMPPKPPAAPSKASASSSSSSSSASTENLSFNNLSFNLGSPAPSASASSSTPSEPSSLLSTLKPDNIIESSILSSPTVVARLIQLLPEGQQTETHLLDNLRSPQLRQSIASLESALNGDSFASVLANFGVALSEEGVEAINIGDGVKGFLESLIKMIEKEKETEGKE